MMHHNDNLPNPFQQLFDMMRVLERKVDALTNERGTFKEVEQTKDELMTVETAADYLSMSRSSIYQLTSRLEIPFMKKGKRLYFKKEELRQWVEEGSNKPFSLEEKQVRALSHLRPSRRKLR
jgi:excisionase family DNA binding protein